ncbi:MAG: hypothetical protein OFPII_18910 [Osedax symbiont Rs1]|nr:MAG: hypothetical protein OFPII_18910 [Osedax symbiont Rs1]
MPQRTTEWFENINFSYHEKQFKETYRSTVHFCNWLEKSEVINRECKLTIFDFASGQGANIYYMSKRYPNCNFIGIEINPKLVLIGNTFFEKNNIKNCQLIEADMLNIDGIKYPKADVIISFQTLSWMPEYEKPLQKMIDLQPTWIALTSLFYEGPISCKIQVQDYDDHLSPSIQSYYNILSIPLIEDYFSKNKYHKFNYLAFDIDIDIPKNSNGSRGTYTKKLDTGKRIQISGPLLMPWYFILASKQ